MKILLILLFGAFIAACSTTRELSNSAISNGLEHFEEPLVEPRKSVPTEWWIRTISQNGRIAQVGATGGSPNGPVDTVLEIQCPTVQNNVSVIDLIVRDTDKVPDFDFDSFEGPYAPNKNRKLIEIVAFSEMKQIHTRTTASGYYGGLGEPDAFVFGIGTERLASSLASQDVRLKVIVHDASDARKTIEATFPQIEPKSEVAKTLNGCRP